MVLEFKNAVNIEIIDFWLIHLEFPLLDLLNIDLQDTYLSDED